jgi:hypothetical protein
MKPPLRAELRQSLSLIAATALTMLVTIALGVLAAHAGA